MLTILLATHNGEETVGRFLAALCELVEPGISWDVLVVNNASSDRTGDVLARFEGRLPLTVVEFPVQGKNRALNHGLRYVRGDVVVLTDDDILPEPGWLTAIRTRAERHPDVDLFGGPILPEWEREPPPWIESHAHLRAAFGLTPPDLPEGPVDAGRIWGGNMFVRRRVFDRGLRFDEGRGPGVGHYVMGGDTEFTVRAAAAGHASWWCPDVRVRHIIRSHQLTRRWLLKRAYRHGKGVYRVGACDSRLGFPAFVVRQAAEALVKAVLRDLKRDEQGAFQEWWRFFHLCGSMVQARAARGGAA